MTFLQHINLLHLRKNDHGLMNLMSVVYLSQIILFELFFHDFLNQIH